MSNDSHNEILEITDEGTITTHLTLAADGPNVISNQVGIGYFDNKITLYAMERGFVQFDGDGQIINELEIPYSHSYLFFFPYLHIFPSENGYAYLKPLTEDIFVDGMGENFTRHITKCCSWKLMTPWLMN